MGKLKILAIIFAILGIISILLDNMLLGIIFIILYSFNLYLDWSKTK